jgi:hypothetical protein
MFSTSTHQIHSVAIRRAKFDIFATVEEALTEAFRDIEIERFNGDLSGIGYLSPRNIDEFGLSGRAGE